MKDHDRASSDSVTPSPLHPLSPSLPRWLVAPLVAATAATALWVWPHGLGYFNQLWGGPATGYTRLHDSNYDWGQGLPELKRWHADRAGGRPLAVWYFGTDPAILFPPFRSVAISHLPLTTAADVRNAVGDGYLAVSVSVLHGNTGITPSTQVAVDWLRTQTPVARTHTFLIYDVR